MSYSSLVLADAPQAYYRLGESSGTTATDASGNGYNGTYSATGVTLAQTGLLAQDSDTAALFDGVAGKIDLPSGISPAGYSALTLEAWFSLSTITFGSVVRLIANATTTSNKGVNLYLNASAASIEVTLGNGTSDFSVTGTYPFQANITYHAVVTWDGSTITLYVNGQSLGTASMTGTIAASTTHIGIGYGPVNGNAFFPGVLDEVAMYNTALPAARVACHTIAGLFGTSRPTPADNPYGFTMFHPSGTGIGKMLPQMPQVIADMMSNGVSWLNYQIPWARIETQQSPVVYQWGALDAAVAASNAAGISLMFDIFSPPSWQQTRASTDGTYHFADIAGTTTFATAIASRYNGVFNVPNYGPLQIAGMMIGNEDYDLFANTTQTRDEGGTYLAPVMVSVVPAVLGVNPDCLVIPACLLKQDATHVANWIADYYAGGAGPYTNVMHFHFYKGSGNDPLTTGYTLDQAWQAIDQANIAAGYDNMPIWMTETGWPTTTQNHSAGDVVTPAVQWQYWQEELDNARTNGRVTKIMWYEIGTNDGDSVTQHGPGVDGTLETYVQPTWSNLLSYTGTYQSWPYSYNNPNTGGGGGGTGGGGTGGGTGGGGGGTVTGASSYSVTIDGQPVFVDAGSLLVDSTIGKVSTADFTAHTSDTQTHFQQYQTVQIYDQNGTLTFSGYLNLPLKEQKPGFQQSLEHTLTCMDQHWLAKKRIVAATYVNKTVGFIAQDLLNNILSQEGVTRGQIYDGLTPSDTLYPADTLYPGGNVGLIPSAVFAYCTVSDALDALVAQASEAGVPYYWQIDQNKQLWVVPYTAVVNPTILDGSTIDDGTRCGQAPYVQRQNPTYRNAQYLIGGVAQTVVQTETKVGDGNAQSWTMGYDLASLPTISTSLNGAAYAQKTVGLKGTTGSDFYWAQGDPVIVQDSAGTKLRGSPQNDLLKVVYTGQYPTVIYTPNGAQISYQASLDTSSGIVEEVETDTTITDEAGGLTKASALLNRYGVQGTIFVGWTLTPGYAPGQLVTVNLPMHALSGVQMLIADVQATDQVDGVNIWYVITAIAGPYDVTWESFWTSIIGRTQTANPINVGVSQTVTLVKNFILNLTPTITMTASAHTCPLPSNTLFPSDTLFPC